MALITCAECSKEVSEFAPSCPHCGFPIAAITKEGRVALRNCPNCGGTGTQRDECSHCSKGMATCRRCKGGGYWLDDPCPVCSGSGRLRCDYCHGQVYFEHECQTCGHSGQVTLREYEEIMTSRRVLEEASQKESQAKLSEKQANEQEETAQKLSALRERLDNVNDALLPLGIAQGALILADSAYAVDRAKIMKIHGEQLHALRGYRYQCQFCGEPLAWKERLRKLPVHDKQDCKAGWERVSKKIAENNAQYEEFMLEHAEQVEEED